MASLLGLLGGTDHQIAWAEHRPLPNRYAVHVGITGKIGRFAGLLQLGLATGRTERFYGVIQLAPYNVIYDRSVGLVQLGGVNQLGRSHDDEPWNLPVDGGRLSLRDHRPARWSVLALGQVGLYNVTLGSALTLVRVGVANRVGKLMGREGRHGGLLDVALYNGDNGSFTGGLRLALVNVGQDLTAVGQLGVLNAIEGRNLRCLLQLGAINFDHGEGSTSTRRFTSMVGLQAGVINAVITERPLFLVAAQVGAFNVAENAVVPVQLGAVVNLALSRLVGGQLAPLNVGRGTFAGAALGLVNVHQRFRGVQIGVVNSARDLRGVQLGLINFSGRGGLRVSPLANVGF